MTCTAARHVPAATTAPKYEPDFSGLRLRMSTDLIGHEDIDDWHDLPDRVRTEHVIAYTRSVGFDAVWSETIEHLSEHRASQICDWMAEYMRADRRNLSPHGAALMGALAGAVEWGLAETLGKMWSSVAELEAREAPDP